ncbi:MAG: hypothetical protein ACFHWZ_04415 [Phycisphaerales bacterium]
MFRAIAPVALALTAAGTTSAGSIVEPFIETFDSNSAGWTNFNGAAALDWFPGGGPNGSAYASGTYNLQNASGFFPPVVLRRRRFGCLRRRARRRLDRLGHRRLHARHPP